MAVALNSSKVNFSMGNRRVGRLVGWGKGNMVICTELEFTLNRIMKTIRLWKGAHGSDLWSGEL